MHVAIVGGTGFIGSYIIDELLRENQQLSVLVRSGSERKLRRPQDCRAVIGDIADTDALDSLLDGCDAVIYCVGILRELQQKSITFEQTQYDGVVNVVMAARRANVTRLLLMSANGVKQPGTTYQETKKRAEDFALASGLDVTILQPSVVFGDPRGLREFATQLYEDMIRPLLPAVNFTIGFASRGGVIRMSPVHVEDVATAFVNALANPSSIGQTYVLGGAETLTWKEMLRRIAAAVGKKKLLVPMPLSVMRLAALLLDRWSFFPVTRDQLTMLSESNIADDRHLRELINRQPRSMSIEALDYL